MAVRGSGSGQAIMLAVGGAAESLHARPGTFDLVLGRRKGFVRIALESGAALVPVVSFGENDMFNTITAKEGTWLALLQRWVARRW
jgi:2-acylglycerol O-acyltransferase 2